MKNFQLILYFDNYIETSYHRYYYNALEMINGTDGVAKGFKLYHKGSIMSKDMVVEDTFVS